MECPDGHGFKIAGACSRTVITLVIRTTDKIGRGARDSPVHDLGIYPRQYP